MEKRNGPVPDSTTGATNENLTGQADYNNFGPIQLDNIPQELKQNCRFCVWKMEKRDGRPTKVPYNPKNGERARTNDPDTFTDFNAAVAAYKTGQYAGLGIHVDGEIAAIDIDHCISKDGALSEMAATVLKAWGEAYFEKSPSGHGLRGFFKVPAGYRYDETEFFIKHGGLEIYLPGMTNRFVTVTGNVYRPGEVADGTKTLSPILEKYMRRGTPAAKHRPAASEHIRDDEAVLSELQNDKKDGAKFKDLFAGRWEERFTSQSEADLSLCRLLALTCGDNPTQIDRLFRQSALMRPKWDEHRGTATYGAMTISKGILWAKQENGQKLSEIELAAAVLLEHDLLFHEATGFYEYDPACGIWVARTSTEIGALCRAFTEGKAKSSLISATIRQLEFATVSTIPVDGFNRNPVIVFSNGVLDTGSLQFSQDFSRDYLATIALPFDYDPAAMCPIWRRFLKTALGAPAIVNLTDPESPDGDGFLRDDTGWAREQVLQEFAGYTFYRSNRELQKAIMLLGEGANGKSVFLNALIKVFGTDNVSHVSIGDMAKPFHLMPLRDKLINIATDEGRSFNDGEEIFKRLSAGDKVSDSWKGQNIINFEPRCKLWMAANRMPKARDKSFGFERRFLFIEWNNRFAATPIRAGDLQADPTLEAKLEAELSGIFNWCLEGYKRLRKQGYFSESPDQNRRLEELRTTVNPLRTFVSDSALSGRIYRDELYAKYREWCLVNGHTPLNNRGFLTELRIVLQELQISFLEGKTGTKYFEFPMKAMSEG